MAFNTYEDTEVLKTCLDYASHDPYLEVLSGFLHIKARCTQWKPSKKVWISSRFDHKLDPQSNLLLLLLRMVGMIDYALILKESNSPGTFARVGLWSRSGEAEEEIEIIEHWRIKTLTIV